MCESDGWLLTAWFLAKGLDTPPTPAADIPVPNIYTQGGRFCRDALTLLH